MFTYNVYKYKGTGEYIHEKEETPVCVCQTQDLAQKFLYELQSNVQEIDGAYPFWQSHDRLIIFFNDSMRSFALFGIEKETVYTTTQEVRGHAALVAENL